MKKANTFHNIMIGVSSLVAVFIIAVLGFQTPVVPGVGSTESTSLGFSLSILPLAGMLLFGVLVYHAKMHGKR